MNNKLYLKIADLNIEINSGIVPMLSVANPNYAQFIRTAIKDCHGNNSRGIDLIWHVEEKNFVVDKDMQEIATFTNSIWHMYRNTAEARFIIPKFPTTAFPTWVLYFTHNFEDVYIYGNENTLAIVNGRKSFSNFFLYPIDHLFFIYYLLKNCGVVIHASGVDIDGKGYLFTGVSGSGKSTITKLFRQCGIASWLSDERIIVKERRCQDNNLYIYGTPWPSSEKRVLNHGIPLAGIFFIAHGAEPVIKPLTSKEAMTKLFAVSAIPWYEKEFAEYGCAVLGKLIDTVPIFEFSYRPEINAVQAWQEFVAKHG